VCFDVLSLLTVNMKGRSALEGEIKRMFLEYEYIVTVRDCKMS